MYKKNATEADGRIEVAVQLVENIFLTQDDKFWNRVMLCRRLYVWKNDKQKIKEEVKGAIDDD